GWLGKKVVDENLAVVKVTIHMLVALVIAALPMLILAKLKKEKIVAGSLLKNLSVIALLLLLVQIIVGTDVREQIDEIAKPLRYEQRELWIANLDTIFLIHRSFSWIVAAACIFLYWKSRSIPSLKGHNVFILSFVGVSIVTGLIMYYLQVPAIAQPVHLFSASLLAISLFSFRLQLK
ncbi:MAG: COX15/CtaA family protein, partial [Chitinophagaceae bacterium]